MIQFVCFVTLLGILVPFPPGAFQGHLRRDLLSLSPDVHQQTVCLTLFSSGISSRLVPNFLLVSESFLFFCQTQARDPSPVLTIPSSMWEFVAEVSFKVQCSG